jgi:hypothetical protein
MRRRVPIGTTRASALLASLFLLATPLRAQMIRGHFVEAGSGAPVEGALIWAYAGDGGRVAGDLTDEEGEFTIFLPRAGSFRLQAERIGYASVISPRLRVGPGATVAYTFQAVERPILLSEVRVEGERRCVIRPEEGLQSARVWEEARKALDAASWTRERGLFRYDVAHFTRDLHPSTLKIRSEERQIRSLVTQNPIRSLPADRLARDGYARELDDGSWDFYAPDAEVLLSHTFLDGHCFRLRADPDRPELVGLSFEPVRRRRAPDVEGVFWLDRGSGELRQVEYRYTALPWDVDYRNIGGQIEFERLPVGAWIIRRWRIRAPQVVRQVSAWRRGRYDGESLVNVREEGGEVVGIHSFEGGVGSVGGAVLSGSVFDSTRSRPLEGAEVYLSGTSHLTRTDSDGRFRMTGLPAGIFHVGFVHPRLDTLQVFPPSPVVELIPGTESRASLAVPSFASISAVGCPENTGQRESGRVAGRILDARSETLEGLATHGQTVRGFLLEAGTDRPIVDGSVVLERDGGERLDVATSDSTGRFRLLAPSGGHYFLQAAREGFLSRRGGPVSVGAGDLVEVEFRLATQPLEVDPLSVLAEAKVQLLETVGFYERAEHTPAHFFARDEIRKRSADRITNLLRVLPGLRVAETDHGNLVWFRSAERRGGEDGLEICHPRLIMDGIEMNPGGVPALVDELVHPMDIMGIEVYASPAELPARFSEVHSACGLIVIWTGRS